MHLSRRSNVTMPNSSPRQLFPSISSAQSLIDVLWKTASTMLTTIFFPVDHHLRQSRGNSPRITVSFCLSYFACRAAGFYCFQELSPCMTALTLTIMRCMTLAVLVCPSPSVVFGRPSQRRYLTRISRPSPVACLPRAARRGSDKHTTLIGIPLENVESQD